MKEPRKYQKVRRAELEEETRLRITEALVELHGSIGPFRTTVSAVAEQAGVQRATVYRHFPDEPSMFAACSTHWMEANPFPNPAEWGSIQDPKQRTRVALGEMYTFYAGNTGMLTNIFRDADVMESLRPAMQGLRNYLAVARDVVVEGFAPRKRNLPVVRAAVGHALSFSTWKSLSCENGLSQELAVSLMAGMIEGSTGNS